MSKKAIKVSHNGETKRFKITQSYETLALQTREMFGSDLTKVWPIKFYYVDDEQELISISSQSDFQEALTIDELPILKLTVANNVNEARIQLEALHSQSLSLTESMNQSSLMNSSMRMSTQFGNNNPFGNIPVISRAPDMNPFPTAVLDTERAEYKKISHEMGVGSDRVISVAQSVSTDVKELVTRDEIGTNTRNATTIDANINTNQVAMSQVSTQAEAQTQEMGCDGEPAIKTVHNGNQMEEVKQANQQIECNILEPFDSNEEDEECIEEQIDCFKCKGTQVNSKGLPCRKCNGSGQFNLKGYSSVVKSVREEIEVYCTEQFRTLYQEYASKNKAFQKDQIHTDYSCNECGVDPIQGIRYSCTQIEDYDLCEKCEAKGIHSDYTMLKIRKVNQSQHQIMCQYHNNAAPNVEPKQPMQESISTFVKPSNRQDKNAGKNIRYQGRFVKESIGDKHQVQPGELFTKTWTYRNGGETAWPKDVSFYQTSGDEMGAKWPIECSRIVEADQEYTWEISFKAPHRVGKYTSYFRMQTGHNIRFGHKVWCDIQVVAPEAIEEEAKQEVLVDQSAFEQEIIQPLPKPEDLIAKVPIVIAKEEEEEVKEQPKVEEPIELKRSQTPKEIYFAKVVIVNNQQTANALTQLFEFGYVDFENNMNVLAKFNYSLEAVMNHYLDTMN